MARIHAGFRSGSNIMKYESRPADNGNSPSGRNGTESFVRGAVSAAGASAGCLYIISGRSLVRLLQYPDDTAGFEEEIDAASDSPVSKCVRTGLDWAGFCPAAKEEDRLTEYAFPLFSSGEAIGAFVLLGIDTAMPGWDSIIRLLKGTAGAVMPSSLGHSDFEAMQDASRELSAFMSDRRERKPTKNSLTVLAEWLVSRLNVSSVTLITPLPGEIQKICIAGQPNDYSTLDDAIALSLEEGRIVRRTISASANNETVCISVIPVGRNDSRVAAVLEFKSVQDGTAEDVAGRFISAALEIIEHEFNSYAFWADIIEAIDDSVLQFLRKRGSDTSEMVFGIFNTLVTKGYIHGFSVLTSEEMPDDIRRQKHPYAELTAAEKETCRAVISDSTVRSVSCDSSSLAIPIADGKGSVFAVILRMGWPVVLPSELTAWSRMSVVFGILLRTFTSRIRDRELTERSSQMQANVERLSDVYTSVFNNRSVREVLAAVNGFMRHISGTMSAAYYEEGNKFHRLDDGEGARVVISTGLLESMVASSVTLSRHIHRLNYSSFSDVLSKLFPDHGSNTFYIMTAENENAAYQCFIVFAIDQQASLNEVLSHTLIELSLYFNLKTIMIGELIAAKTNSRLIDYVRELLDMISQAENTNNILKRIMDASSTITASPMAILAVHNLSSGRETLGMTIGFKKSSENGDAASLSRGIVGRTLRSGEPEIVNDYPNDRDAVEEHVLTNSIERIACIPINIGIREKGYIAVMNTSDRRYSQRHIRCMQTLSNLASLAIRLNGARMERSLLLSDFDRLQDAEIALYSSRSMYALQQTLAMETKTLISATDVILVSEVGGTKRTVCSTCPAIDDGSVVYDGSVIGMQFDHQPHAARTVEVARMEEEWASRLNMKEVMMVKVHAADSMVIVAFNKSTGGPFDENDAYKVAKLSRIAAAAIDKVHLVERLNRQLKQIEIMHTIVNGVIQGRAEEELMKETMPKVVEMIDGDFGLLWKHDRERNKNVVISEFYRTDETEHLIGQEFDAGKGITGTVFSTRKPLLVTNAATDNFAVQIEGTKKQAFETLISVPLMMHDEMLGVLSVYRNNPPSFSNSELNLLSNLSNDISLVMAKYSPASKGGAENAG